MAKGLTINRGQHTPLSLRLRWLKTLVLVGHRRRRRLHHEVHRLRREVRQLRRDNDALAERNHSVEHLSTELMKFNLGLSEANRLDPMTGLLNRAAFESCLAQEHALADAAQRKGLARPYSVIMLDVDHFKAYNDALGHPAGDRCLVQIAQAIQSTVRQADFVGRYGGEEIIVLCPNLDREQAVGLADRLRQSVRDLNLRHPENSAGPIVTVSLGLATGGAKAAGEAEINEDESQFAQGTAAVVLAADQMLYQAKHAGRDRVAAA